MGQAKNRKTEIDKLKAGGTNVKIYTMEKNSHAEALLKSTGHTYLDFEDFEKFGMRVADNMSKQMFGEDTNLPSEELYVGAWTNKIVEIKGRGNGIERIILRVPDKNVVVTRPKQNGRDEYTSYTLTPIEAALTRFAYAANSLSWYCHSFGDTQVGIFAVFTGEESANLYHAAMFAASELKCRNIFSYLD